MNWDEYFHGICEAISAKSPCLSRHIGAIIVRDHSILSTGYNGPARGIPHCGIDRLNHDKTLTQCLLDRRLIKEGALYPAHWSDSCPRKIIEYPSGTGMQWCHAQHAEENAISNAARNGVNVYGATLYLNTVIPCKNCFSTIINAGIVEVVCDSMTLYDQHSQFIINNSSIKVREFNLEHD